MKTKLDCRAGWHALDLEGLTQQSPPLCKPAGEISNHSGGGAGRRRTMVAAGGAGGLPPSALVDRGSLRRSPRGINHVIGRGATLNPLTGPLTPCLGSRESESKAKLYEHVIIRPCVKVFGRRRRCCENTQEGVPHVDWGAQERFKRRRYPD